MGMFSWFTQDTNHRIVNGDRFNVIMTDDKGNQYEEDCYEGYGVFCGKDYYELLAEMNGLASDRQVGIELAFEGSPLGENPNCKFPSLSESGEYFNGKSPLIDPNQGFSDYEDEFDEDYE